MARGLRGAIAARRAGKALTPAQRRVLIAAELRAKGKTWKGQGAKPPRKPIRQRLDSNKGGTWKGRADEVRGVKAPYQGYKPVSRKKDVAITAGLATAGGVGMTYLMEKRRKRKEGR